MTALPPLETMGVVCAHPDDETFGLGAVIATLVDAGTRMRLLCLTRGERSTLGASADLAVRRTGELERAARVLGIEQVVVRDHPDGALDSVDLDLLVDDVATALGAVDALLTFDHGGVTGHPDHQHATDVAVAAGRRLGVPVLGWTVPERTAATLTAEFGATFVGRSDHDIDHVLVVDRARQVAAMACHASQGNPVPGRRMELQGTQEHLRVLHRPDATGQAR